MREITSLQNPGIKTIRTLKTRAGREEAGLFVVEGEKCVEEALGGAQVETILFGREGMVRYAGLAEKAEAAGIETCLVPRHIIETLSDQKTPQEVLCTVRIPQERHLPEGGLVAALENVADPKNIGAIIRTADAVAASAVLLSKGCADPYSLAAVRASMGSLFHIPVIVCEDFFQELAHYAASGRPVVAGHLSGKWEMPDTRDMMILIGNESRGLSAAAAQAATHLCKIPIFGRAESLNASVAAGILLYHACGAL